MKPLIQLLTLFKTCVLVLFFIFANTSWRAQNPNQLVYEGNSSFHKKDMQSAINKYNEALKLQPNHKKAMYNLGNALYKEALTLKFSNNLAMPVQNKDSIADLMLQRSAELYNASSQLYQPNKNKDTLQKIYHNLGNAFLFQKKYDEAINAYKKALKLNPADEDTRYNLAYALKHKNDNQGGGGQNKQPQQSPQQQKQQPQPQISKEQAERLLQTLIQREKELQSKKQEQPAGHPAKPEKDW